MIILKGIETPETLASQSRMRGYFVPRRSETLFVKGKKVKRLKCKSLNRPCDSKTVEVVRVSGAVEVAVSHTHKRSKAVPATTT